IIKFEEIPWCFLRRLLKINAECRNATQLPKSNDDLEEDDDIFEIDPYTADNSAYNGVHPLDLIMALFLCADSFLKQEMALKMSMCQFSVPLLLPHGNKNQCSLMLWALRDIVKEWRPHDLSQSRGFVEDNIVQAKMPFYSFVRLKNCSLSKSQILNQVLSRGQQNHNIFIHREMKGGTLHREIANGLAEVCWYLPCGRENLDIFPEPVAFANLRGDICESLAQFNFLYQVSTATFVFLDKIEENEHKILTSLQDTTSKLFLVVNRRDDGAREDMMSIKTTDIKVNSHYKKQQLLLQEDNWKRLSQLEKEECRLKNSGDSGLEEYKAQLQEEQKQIKEEQKKYKLSEGMKTFIDNLSTSDKEKRDFFLKWMKLKLDTQSRSRLPALRNKFKEASKAKDAKVMAELDQTFLNASLGIEHYMREMGLIYEVSLHSQESADKMSHLPGVAAEMLLDGYPLELLDGDASNIPQRWVTDVLMELHKKVGESSRLLVLTVLGVQSSGKSTLLNTMFGVQFPVSSGRCTRGAYMVFLRVGEDLKRELNYDFVVLIDTEGLKSPDLAQLEDSYEHDNQLATFVIGLSDVTIINIAMENANEMKDVLQITAHAFLRIRQIGKKPVCHFVHQNVAGVSAHSKCMTERQHLLDQLNEMTQIAAEMERQPSFKAFTDVLDYDIEKNNWNIPGLWHGIPPMAPVNTGYSEAVADFKKNLLETMKSDRSNETTQIPEFLEWMKSLWKALKYENFIFSFRNTLVAHAYDNLCKHFSQWEWEFRKDILSWETEAETEIKNADIESQLGTWSELVEFKKSDVSRKIQNGQKIMTKKLREYYQNKDRHVNLIEKYKTDFIKRINSIETQRSVATKLDCILELKISSEKAQDIQRQYRGVIEEKVMKLLSECKDDKLSDEKLTDEFEDMWAKATANISGLKERDITRCVLMQLRKSFSNRNEAGRDRFETHRDNVIESCTRFIHDKANTDGDYHDSFTMDLLEKINEFLQQSDKQHKTNTKYEIELKLHICGIATREFLKMHRKYLSDNDPNTQLQKYKTQYLSDFLDLYKARDDCQLKATDFARFCIKPAVEDYINRSLGIDIVEEMLSSSHSVQYSSRSFFQYNIQKELLHKEDFKSFVKYICNYENYVKDWIYQHIQQKMSEDKSLYKLKNKNLQIIVKKVTEALEQASKGENGVLLPDNTESIKELISNMRKYLIKDISLSVEAEQTILFQIKSTCHPFIKSLKNSIQDLREQLQEEFSNPDDIIETLAKLPIKPQDELFKRVFGCGQRCPFCKVPCEAGGKEHKQHHAALHWPQGLGGYCYEDSGKLMETLCTTDVHSERNFQNADTKWESKPFKQYTKYYPDWHIPPDPTIEASDYWKYVLVQYNDKFAEEYKAKPADVPKAWRSITKEQALKGLKEAFNMENHSTTTAAQ
uniref:VLIG-type G domain-containing protein n=1 Tax=Stegastes partitus TaxID=144197 RepID=A0A3B5AMP4_9TELE